MDKLFREQFVVILNWLKMSSWNKRNHIKLISKMIILNSKLFIGFDLKENNIFSDWTCPIKFYHFFVFTMKIHYS